MEFCHNASLWQDNSQERYDIYMDFADYDNCFHGGFVVGLYADGGADIDLVAVSTHEHSDHHLSV